jgi:hypothetical protein
LFWHGLGQPAPKIKGNKDKKLQTIKTDFNFIIAISLSFRFLTLLSYWPHEHIGKALRSQLLSQYYPKQLIARSSLLMKEV